MKKKNCRHEGNIIMLHEQEVAMEEKAQVDRACINGEMSICKANRKIGISPSTTKEWISRYDFTVPRNLPILAMAHIKCH